MRLTESEILAGLEHSDVFVRDAVVDYLQDAGRTQADVTRRIVAAVERFGWKDVLHYPHRVAMFELDETTLPWAIDQIERKDADAPPENMCWHLAYMLADSPIAVVRPHLARILDLEILHERRTKASGYHRTNAELLELRCDLWDKSPDQCWTLLDEHCRTVANVKSFAEADIPYAEALLERIASKGESISTDVLQILEQSTQPGNGYQDWLVGLMMTLAGLLRLEPATGLLYRKFTVDWDWYNEEAMRALVKIGTPSVTAMVSEKYADSPWHVRNYSLGVLGAVHHDASVPEILRLVPTELEDDLRGRLGAVLASHWDERGIEPALAIYREEPDDPERLEIIERLFAHACLADLDIPEMEQWERSIKANWEHFNKQRGEADRLVEAMLQVEDNWSTSEWSDDDDIEDDESPGVLSLGFHETSDEGGHFQKSQPIVREATRVGRNDRCPCGSGKKYKNCCLRKAPK
jgi:hypothetical protein